MHLISRTIFITEGIGFPQRYIGKFISLKLRSSTAGLDFPEFSKKEKKRKDWKRRRQFVSLAFLFILLILEHEDTAFIRNVGRY